MTAVGRFRTDRKQKYAYCQWLLLRNSKVWLKNCECLLELSLIKQKGVFLM